MSPRAGQVVLASIAALIAAAWISICAAAPEFIWQGFRLALGHISGRDLLAALLIGLVLAFFVEPVMEHARLLLARLQRRPHVDHQPHDALFTAGLALAFALTSICLHEAMTAFVSARGSEDPDAYAGLAGGVELTISWAIVPFAVTIAWLAVRPLWLAVPTGIFAVASSWFTAWLYSWPVQSAITTMIPCVVILGLGYRHILRSPRQRVLARCARTVAVVGTIWLIIAVVFDTTMGLFHLDRLELYRRTKLLDGRALLHRLGNRPGIDPVTLSPHGTRQFAIAGCATFTPLNAGITSRANHSSCSSASDSGTPTDRLTVTRSSPG